MSVAPAQYKPVVLNLFTEGPKSRYTILWESHTKKILTQVNSHVLFYCRTKSVTQNIRDFIYRCSQGGLWAIPSLIFRTYSRFVLWQAVSQTKQCQQFTPPLFWFPPNFWAGYAAGFIETLLRTAQKVLGSCMWLSEKWCKFASGAAFEVMIVAACFKRWLLRPVRWWRHWFIRSNLQNDTETVLKVSVGVSVLHMHFFGCEYVLPGWACEWMLV